MKRYVGLIVVVVGFIVAAVVAYTKYKSKMVETERDQDMARITQEYFERVGWMRANPDDKAYKDEVTTFFRWYFREINDHLNKYNGNRDFDDYLTELETRKKAAGKEQQFSDKRAAYDYVKKTFDLFKDGKYAPIFSGSDKGMRLDIASADVKMVAGKPQIVLPIVLWGAQREMREEGHTRKMATSAAFTVNWKLYDEKGKLYGEMTASGGDPAMKVDNPERYIKEFPPQMVIGHYDMDLLPAQVAKLEITFTVASHSPSGGDANANFVWKLDTPAEWKLKAGEKWEGAEESVRPEEEIDPAAAARANAKPAHGQARK